MADRDILYRIVIAVEDVIFDRASEFTADNFLDAWSSINASQRQTIYRLYHLALRDVYYNRSSLGQTVIRAVTAL